MAELLDNCRFTAGSMGTSDFADGTATPSFRNLEDAGAVNGVMYPYKAQNATGSEWEIGRGTAIDTAGTWTFERTNIEDSSNGGSAVNFNTNPVVIISVGKTEFDKRVRADASQSFSASEKAQARANIYAAPFDAMAYHGLQVNGFQQISQERGNVAATASGLYPVDQEVVNFAGAVVASFKRVESSPFSTRPDITRAIEIEITTADTSIGATDTLLLQQRIEGERLRGRLAWGTSLARPLSICRVLRSNVSGRGYLSVRNGAADRSYVVPFDLVANTDTFVSITIPGDTSGTWAIDNTTGLILAWTFTCGSTYHTTAGAWQAGQFLAASDISNFSGTIGNKVWAGPVVVLPGIEFPRFDQIMLCQRMSAEEMSICQRYYETNYKIGTSPGTSIQAAGGSLTTNGGDVAGTIVARGLSAGGRGWAWQAYSAPKRDTPTIAYWDLQGNASAFTAYDVSGTGGAANNTVDTFRAITGGTKHIVATNAPGGSYWYSACMWAANARLS